MRSPCGSAEAGAIAANAPATEASKTVNRMKRFICLSLDCIPGNDAFVT
jgi:hypothetical protein